jgi:hypothetical protein
VRDRPYITNLCGIFWLLKLTVCSSSLLLTCPANPLVRNRRMKQTSRSFRVGFRIAPPITDLASSRHILSVVSVYYGSLRLPRPPFCPLTWHAHPLKSLLIGASPSWRWIASGGHFHPPDYQNQCCQFVRTVARKNYDLNRDLSVRRR